MDPLRPPYGERDAGGMAARIAGEATQIEDALARAEREPWRPPGRDPEALVVGALGGSAMPCDLALGLYADRLPRPLIAVRDYAWPAWVDGRALALLVSYSGNTEETLSLYAEAGRRGVPRIAMTTGGALAEACRRDGVPWVSLPGGSPPRAALFGSWVRLTGLLHQLDWVEDPAPGWREAAAVLRARDAELGPESPEERNPAKRLARELHGRFVLAYSGPGAPAAAATRLRQQLHENAKMLGHSAVVPELNHNEIVGWERPGPLRDRAAVVVIRDDEDPPAVAARLSLTAEFAARQGAAAHEIRPAGEGRLARLASLVQFADYLSLYLALLEGVDPTPIASIDAFKRRLAEIGAKRGG